MLSWRNKKNEIFTKHAKHKTNSWEYLYVSASGQGPVVQS